MASTGIDQPGVYYSDTISGGLNQVNETNPNANTSQNRLKFDKEFKQFLRNFQQKTTDGGVVYHYRDTIRKNYNNSKYSLNIDLGDLKNFNRGLWDLIKHEPREYLELFEEAVTFIADEVTRPRPAEDEDIIPMQIIFSDDSNPISIRQVKADKVARLIKVPGIIVNTSTVRTKAREITLQCKSCGYVQPNVYIPAGLDGYQLPKMCPNKENNTKTESCPADPFLILPDKSKHIDFQTMKLQEAPDSVPQGEMPRHITMFAERDLVDTVAPGMKVDVIGIFCIKRQAKAVTSAKSKQVMRGKAGIGIRQAYIRVLGIQPKEEVTQSNNALADLKPEEEQYFRELAARPDIAVLLRDSIAPGIFGSDDIKQSIVSLLLGGSRKKMPDGLTRRGDINVLLLGDPGTAKSQLLKFVEQVAPVCVYTSGKGSSAAGLTASVMKGADRRFTVEAGAMVLADGGTVCIDEFDKMRQDDRVAIHEAMEQQTISIAKAGITTTLNSRCSVLAAANSVFGRWDDTRGEENIDFMPTILSRFDCIFIIKDTHDQQKDCTLARHVMSMHINSGNQAAGANKDEKERLDIKVLRKFIAYCRQRCGPRLSKDACEKLSNRYCEMRSGAGELERQTGKRGAIPLTVRQLEAVVRISESYAKMKLKAFVNEKDVDSALRLFQVSTLDAAMSGDLDGAEGFTSDKDYQELQKIERQMKRRFLIGTQVAEQTIMKDLCQSQNLVERQVKKVLQAMVARGEVEYRMQRKLLYRVK